MRRFLFLMCTILIVCPLLAIAQPDGGPPTDPSTPVPIGGLGILIAIGAGLGIHKIRSSKHKE